MKDILTKAEIRTDLKSRLATIANVPPDLVTLTALLTTPKPGGLGIQVSDVRKTVDAVAVKLLNATIWGTNHYNDNTDTLIDVSDRCHPQFNLVVNDLILKAVFASFNAPAGAVAGTLHKKDWANGMLLIADMTNLGEQTGQELCGKGGIRFSPAVAKEVRKTKTYGQVRDTLVDEIKVWLKSNLC